MVTDRLAPRSRRQELELMKRDDAAAYADQRHRERVTYLHGDERTKQQIVEKWLDDENRRPRGHARVVGLEKAP